MLLVLYISYACIYLIYHGAAADGGSLLSLEEVTAITVIYTALISLFLPYIVSGREKWEEESQMPL